MGHQFSGLFSIQPRYSATGAKYSLKTVVALTAGASTVKVKRPTLPGSTNGWSSGVGRETLIHDACANALPRSRGLVVPRRTTSLVQVAEPTFCASNHEVAVSPDSSVR